MFDGVYMDTPRRINFERDDTPKKNVEIPESEMSLNTYQLNNPISNAVLHVINTYDLNMDKREFKTVLIKELCAVNMDNYINATGYEIHTKQWIIDNWPAILDCMPMKTFEEMLTMIKSKTEEELKTKHVYEETIDSINDYIKEWTLRVGNIHNRILRYDRQEPRYYTNAFERVVSISSGCNEYIPEYIKNRISLLATKYNHSIDINKIPVSTDLHSLERFYSTLSLSVEDEIRFLFRRLENCYIHKKSKGEIRAVMKKLLYISQNYQQIQNIEYVFDYVPTEHQHTPIQQTSYIFEAYNSIIDQPDHIDENMNMLSSQWIQLKSYYNKETAKKRQMQYLQKYQDEPNKKAVGQMLYKAICNRKNTYKHASIFGIGPYVLAPTRLTTFLNITSNVLFGILLVLYAIMILHTYKVFDFTKLLNPVLALL
ncbi:hypothetical protein NEOKW01_1016 [Nematocida sp. AWRm80]|nr:hypothetical protein NEOKW01_1016 [Nematocida sp. AWRm80]